MARVVLDQISKTYPGKNGGSPAVRNLSLTVADGEFMVLVGPSGCGKSTLLRLIAGLESPDSGTIAIDGRTVNGVPPKDRDLAMVFQNYALYPHLTVFENLAFGLRLRKQPREEIAARVAAAAAQLGLADVLDRLPKSLSGGQRQRVAVGRAIVRQPKVFLFDEPLSNLDAKLRATTRTEIARLHARLAATMIYVTHDQVEAMTMGDRICVMKDGCIQQVAAPLELYEHPANLFVAGFIGSPPMNLLAGTLEESATGLDFVATNSPHSPEGAGSDRTNLRIQISDPAFAAHAVGHAGRPVILGLRPEHLHDARTLAATDPARTFPATIEVCEPMGAETFLHLRAGPVTLIARVAPGPRHTVGTTLPMVPALKHAHLFDAVTGLALR